MNFGEKLKKLRQEKGLSQEEVAKAIGITTRAYQNYENVGTHPRYQAMYQKLADLFSCDVNYLRTESDEFVTAAAEEYGPRGARQAQAILDQTAALFAGGELSEDDKLAFLTEIQGLYLDSKNRAKKYTPKKYLHTPEEK